MAESKLKVLYARTPHRFHKLLKQRAKEKKMSLNRYLLRLLTLGFLTELKKEEPHMLDIMKRLFDKFVKNSAMSGLIDDVVDQKPKDVEINHHEECDLNCAECPYSIPVSSVPFSPENN
jgi:hypothetical protein